MTKVCLTLTIEILPLIIIHYLGSERSVTVGNPLNQEYGQQSRFCKNKFGGSDLKHTRETTTTVNLQDNTVFSKIEPM